MNKNRSNKDDEFHKNKNINFFNRFNMKNIYKKIVVTYKELPNYLKTPKKKTDLFSDIGNIGKYSFDRIKKFLSKRF